MTKDNVVLQANQVALPERLAVDAMVEVRDGLIQRVGYWDPGQQPVQQVAGCLLPGLLDLQVNGAAGHSVDEATSQALDSIAEAVRAGGAAGFLPTLITASMSELRQQASQVAEWIQGYEGNGAAPLGLHLEGPFLRQAGTHAAEHFLEPKPEHVEALLQACKGQLRLLTLAPSLPGAARAVQQLREAGVAVALGHDHGSQNIAKDVAACVEAGASMVTHLFNAMGETHHRQPGLATLALDTPQLSASMILDGVHVAPATVRSAFRCLGVDRLILVTDCVSAMGMEDGRYQLAGIEVIRQGNSVRNSQGGLAGSCLDMTGASQGFLQMNPDAGPWSLSRVASTNPARVCGLAEWGSIEVGKQARFTLLRPDGTLHCL